MRRGFTLVELLVVVGIIAILIAVSFPAISNSIEQSRKVTCQSNVRQITMAMIMYAQANGDRMPSIAPCSAAVAPGVPKYVPHDWIHWQPDRDLNQSAIMRYLGKSANKQIFICPTDRVEEHFNNFYSPADGPYFYSYTMNEYLGYYGGNRSRRPPKLSQIRMPAETILIVDQGPTTINDGLWWPGWVGATADYLSTRHDRTTKRTAQFANPTFQSPKGKGVVSFVDGHVDYVTKHYAHNNPYNIPKNYKF